MKYTIVHAHDICVTDIKPIPDVGVSVTNNAQSVTCGACARAGVLPRSDLVTTYINAWATRNGYTATKVADGYQIEYTGGRGIA